jgi:hypothetical protein
VGERAASPSASVHREAGIERVDVPVVIEVARIEWTARRCVASGRYQSDVVLVDITVTIGIARQRQAQPHHIRIMVRGLIGEL